MATALPRQALLTRFTARHQRHLLVVLTPRTLKTRQAREQRRRHEEAPGARTSRGFPKFDAAPRRWEDAKIREICEERGMKFRPWEIRPWKAHDGRRPFGDGTAGAESRPKAQELRRRLIAEIEDEN